MATTLILHDVTQRDKAVKWIRGIPKNSVVTFKKPSRSLAQNDRFWAMLTDIATQSKLNDRKLTPEQWKVVFLFWEELEWRGGSPLFAKHKDE